MPTVCDGCSNCSRSMSAPGEEYCSTCNNSHIDMGSVCDHSHCSEHHQPSSVSSSCHHHHNRHQHHHHHHSEHSSWQEELKSASSISDGNSSVSYHNNSNNHYHHHYKNQAYNPDDLHLDYNNPILPYSTTMNTLHSSKVTHEKHRKRYCFCCKTRTHSRLTVFFVFSLCILGAFAAFFCWPRTPRVSMGGGADSISGPPDWWNGEKQPLPPSDAPIPSRPSLRASWQINVTLDNRDNWIPTRVNQLDFVMVDSLTLAKFAWATTNAPLLLPPGVITPVSLTFNVNYQAADRTDPTFQNLYNACGPISESKQRPALNVILRVRKIGKCTLVFTNSLYL